MSLIDDLNLEVIEEMARENSVSRLTILENSLQKALEECAKESWFALHHLSP